MIPSFTIMIMKKVEILAPAGNMECFLAAMNAGADAVYMAGKAFGARASANNFTEEEFVEALNIAHIHGKKIYLTLNTLIKEREWKDIYTFLKPLYEAGLDGVIIQDYGLIGYLSKQFPHLPLHASTQMTITDSRSANLLKRHGICRVVPARELSLNELKIMKEETGLELETFIHGALCYCYSGQCLFSSYLGGRSGNRGRCAGPCRLPYEVKGLHDKVRTGNEYPLSLKDLCTIEHIKELIEAGIDSFKIEGRMKSPEYVAGVTAIYRKYVDAYYAGRSTKVTDEDINILKSLYLRSSIGSGYYYKHNGAEMISIDDPSYNNQDQNIVKSVHDNIVQEKCTKELHCAAYIHEGEAIQISVWDLDGNSASVTGDIIQAAASRPATYDDIKKQLNKTGGTNYHFAEMSVELGEGCFVPVKVINDIRREALKNYEAILLNEFKRECPDVIAYSDANFESSIDDKINIGVSVLNADLIDAVLKYDIDSLYIPYDLIYSKDVTGLMLSDYKKKNPDLRILITLPRIIRHRDEKYITSLSEFIERNSTNAHDNQDGLIDGILVRNLEEVELLNSIDNKIYRELDYTLYGWNINSQKFLLEYGNRLTMPLELSSYEIKDIGNTDMVVPIYGYASLMVSAGCLAKTYDCCNGKRYGFDFELNDRYNKHEHVFVNCIHCYNEIYNSVPTSYHKKYDTFIKQGFRRFRIDFTMETAKECKRVLDYYFNDGAYASPADEFTLGHIDKGAI